MVLHKIKAVQRAENLADRVNRFFKDSKKARSTSYQLSLDLFQESSEKFTFKSPSQNTYEFLNLLTHAMPDGDIYLFGGLLRDLALIGRRGFNSDIDLVVDGNWYNLVPYLKSLHATKNKFGGYRLNIGGWPIDIWNAKETWAFREGIIEYESIFSLTKTTVLNWDAILMNWRTKEIICRDNYFEELNLRVLDVVLEENPNPLGMAVRVFRHLCTKDAKKITWNAAKFLAKSGRKYSFKELKDAELESYSDSVIEPAIYAFFRQIDPTKKESPQHQFNIASDIVKRELAFS